MQTAVNDGDLAGSYQMARYQFRKPLAVRPAWTAQMSAQAMLQHAFEQLLQAASDGHLTILSAKQLASRLVKRHAWQNGIVEHPVTQRFIAQIIEVFHEDFTSPSLMKVSFLVEMHAAEYSLPDAWRIACFLDGAC